MTVSYQLLVSVSWISMARVLERSSYLGSQLTVHWAVGSRDARQFVALVLCKTHLRMRVDAAAHKPHSPPLTLHEAVKQP